MLHNLVQQHSQGPSNFFEALSGEARESVMRAREASAGTTKTAAVGTDHLLAGVVTGENVATEALGRAGANVDKMRSDFGGQRGDPGDQIYTFTPSAKRALQLAFTAVAAEVSVAAEASAVRAVSRRRRARLLPWIR
jgi:ATP-dependent Clp protease ATP-binding subunit ClpC